MSSYQFNSQSLALALFISLAVASFDLLTKMIIVDLIMQPPRTIPVTTFLNLTLGFNPGISFGLFSDFFASNPILLICVSVAITLVLWAWAAVAKSLVQSVLLGSVSGGAIGNIGDRVLRGAVTDFIDLHIGQWHWPAFNLADSAIVLGAAGLVIATVTDSRNGTRSER